jgi:hypothetical protein
VWPSFIMQHILSCGNVQHGHQHYKHRCGPPLQCRHALLWCFCGNVQHGHIALQAQQLRFTWTDHGYLRCSRSVETVISIQHNEESAFSTLHIKTLDRPGLLVEIVKVLKDINVNVISAEVRPAARAAHAKQLSVCATHTALAMHALPCRWLHDPSRRTFV